jgi:short-subunit dehydrogenase
MAYSLQRYAPGFTHTEFHEVAGMMDTKNSSPNWIWYDASTVVTDGISGCESGRAVVISGRLYRWLDPFPSFRTSKANPIAAGRYSIEGPSGR